MFIKTFDNQFPRIIIIKYGSQISSYFKFKICYHNIRMRCLRCYHSKLQMSMYLLYYYNYMYNVINTIFNPTDNSYTAQLHPYINKNSMKQTRKALPEIRKHYVTRVMTIIPDISPSALLRLLPITANVTYFIHLRLRDLRQCNSQFIR
jgi:hypothetical protein